MKVVLAPEAINDLIEIGSFIGRDSPARARAFVNALQAQCLSLQENFFRHPIFRGSDEDSIRRLNYREYMIFYKVTPTCVSIVRVIHGARDLDTIFDL